MYEQLAQKAEVLTRLESIVCLQGLPFLYHKASPNAGPHELQSQAGHMSWCLGFLPQYYTNSSSPPKDEMKSFAIAILNFFVMPQYVYSPLEPGSDIRLIRLWPAPAWTPKIEFDIFHAEKAMNPLYEALSYVWGEPDRTDVANVNHRGDTLILKTDAGSVGNVEEDFTLPITHNLAVALRHLRSSRSPRVLWVDAICINQEDIPERSKEVNDMSAIYSNAQQAIVWLGAASHDSRLALNTLARIAEDVDFSDEDNYAIPWPGTWTKHLEDDSRLVQLSYRRWVAIRDLLRRKWFTRLWVFQEIALSTNCTVTVGANSLDWAKFRIGLFWVWRMVPRLNQLHDSLNIEDLGSNHIRGFLVVTRKDTKINMALLEAIYFTNHLSCFDDRDRYFAIRSFLPPYERKLISPDYSRTVQEIYTNTARSFIEEYSVLNMLALCLLKRSSSILNLPSWVPDISSRIPQKLVPTECYAAGFSKGCYSFGQGNVLMVQGVEVTEITYVVASAFDIEITNGKLFNLVRQAWETLPAADSYVAGGSTLDAFLDVIVCGRTKEKMNPDMGNFASMSDRKEVFKELWAKDEGSAWPGSFTYELAQDLKRSFLGRAFFTTGKGYIGMGPESAESGDVVGVILGCCSPLLLRPLQQGKQEYSVVGECYVPGIMNTEVLLGPLPTGWNRRYAWSTTDRAVILYEGGSTTTQDDPRASAFPPGWRNRFGTPENQLIDEPKYTSDVGRIWWDNVDSRDRSWYDPRLTAELLRVRGTNIQEFKLI